MVNCIYENNEKKSTDWINNRYCTTVKGTLLFSQFLTAHVLPTKNPKFVLGVWKFWIPPGFLMARGETVNTDKELWRQKQSDREHCGKGQWELWGMIKSAGNDCYFCGQITAWFIGEQEHFMVTSCKRNEAARHEDVELWVMFQREWMKALENSHDSCWFRSGNAEIWILIPWVRQMWTVWKGEMGKQD